MNKQLAEEHLYKTNKQKKKVKKKKTLSQVFKILIKTMKHHLSTIRLAKIKYPLLSRI